MYSREETLLLKHEFWIAFAEKYPRKWLLHDTKIKDFSFKFYVDNKKAQVIIAIENRNIDKRIAYFEKIVALKNILEEEFIQNLVFEKNFYCDNGKIISQIWIEKLGVSNSNKNQWNDIFYFFNEKMKLFEAFYEEYEGFIKEI